MATSEADVLARISALETAMARGEREVDFGDRRVVYKSTGEQLASINYFKDLLSKLRGKTSRRKQVYGVASKGF